MLVYPRQLNIRIRRICDHQYVDNLRADHFRHGMPKNILDLHRGSASGKGIGGSREVSYGRRVQIVQAGRRRTDDFRRPAVNEPLELGRCILPQAARARAKDILSTHGDG
jgi:hypothetical protein